MVESAIKIVYQRVFAPLRNSLFLSIEELNQAIRERLERHNRAPFQRTRGISRVSPATTSHDVKKNRLFQTA